jgi:hypothetical protein
VFLADVLGFEMSAMLNFISAGEQEDLRLRDFPAEIEISRNNNPARCAFSIGYQRPGRSRWTEDSHAENAPLHNRGDALRDRRPRTGATSERR